MIKPYLAQAGVTRIADVTGLDNIGIPTTLALRPNALTIACSSGKGLSLEQAYISGAMEAIELYAAENAVLSSIHGTYADIARQHRIPAVHDLPLARWSTFSQKWPIHWYLGWDLLEQSEIAIPLALVGMSRQRAVVETLGFFQVSSNGLGAGNSLLEAILAGLYECIERDAVACSHHAALNRGHRIPVVPDEILRSYPLVAEAMARCDAAGVKVVVNDCSIDTGIPTFFAVAYDRTDKGVGVVRGSGTHLDPEIAILRAVTEAVQARLNFIAGSRDDIFRTAFVRIRAEWGKQVAAIESNLLDPCVAGRRESLVGESFEDDLSQLIDRVRAVGICSIVVADLTPADFPVKVVRVFVPGFEGYMHHGYLAGRRAQAFLPPEDLN